MSWHDGASSHFGLGRGSTRDPTDDHRSSCSADGRNARDPLSVSEVGVVTPAQAYASAVKTGETHDRALCYTIERRQPSRKGKADLQFVPSHLGNPGSPERGLSFAQRLYASALSDKSSTSSNIPALPPIKHTSSSALPIGGGGQVSCGVPHRRTLPSTSLFDTSSDVSQSFNPSDLYHSSVATHRFPLRGSTSPEMSATCPPSLLPVFQIPNSMSVAHSLYPANPLASYSSSQNFTPQSGVQNPRPVLHQSQTVSIEPQSHSTSVLSIHGASGLRIPSLPPLEQQLVISPSSSPPSFEEHGQLSNLSEEVVADAVPVVIQPPAAVSLGDGLPDGSLQPSIEVNQEDVPLYSLVDEQRPPPAFDDLQMTSTAEATGVVRPETLPQEVVEAPSSQLPSPSQYPSPFSHGSTACALGEALLYALSDPTSYSVVTRKDILQDAKVPLSSTTTWHPSDPSSSDLPSVVTGFKWSNRLPSTSPIPPSSAVPHDGSSMTPLLPPNSRLVLLSSPHSPDSQSTRASCVPPSDHNSTTSPPPLVNYHTKPTVKQGGQPFLPPLALPSGSRFPEGSNTVSQARRDSRPLVNAAEDIDAIDSLTHSVSDMMGEFLSDTHSLACKKLSSGRPASLATTLGNQRNIPIIPTSHPSGIPNAIGSLNQERRRPKAERLIQEACWRPAHAEIGGRAADGIQGLNLGSLHEPRQEGYVGLTQTKVPTANPPVATNILSSQYSPRTFPSPGPIPSPRSHDGLQTVPSFCTAGDEFTFSQFGETVALSASTSTYSDQPHVASLLPSRLFPYSLQPSHHSIDRDVRGSIVPSGSVPPQQQKNRSLGNSDLMKCGGRGLPPPPIALRPTNVPQMPQTSSYSQDSAKDQFGPSNMAPALSPNDPTRNFVHNALMTPSSAPASAFYRSNQH